MLPFAEAQLLEQIERQLQQAGLRYEHSLVDVPPNFAALGVVNYPASLAANLRQVYFSDAGEDHWAYLSLIQQQADLNGVCMTGVGHDIDASDWSQIEAALNPLLASFADHVYPDSGQGWWLRSQSAFGFSAPPAHRLGGKMLNDFIAHEPKHKPWRILSSEIEMSLHMLEQPGGLNGVWLWGAGQFQRLEPSEHQLYTNDPYIRYLMNQGKLMEIPEAFEEGLGDSPLVEFEHINSDFFIQHWLLPAIARLKKKRIKHLSLWFADHVQLSVEAGTASFFKRWFA